MSRRQKQLSLIYDPIAEEKEYQAKITRSIDVILAWYMFCDGKVMVSYSGGIDSSVLLHLVRKTIKKEFNVDVLACFMDTGVEFKEIRDTVKEQDNVTTLRPKVNGKRISFKDFVLGENHFAGKRLAGYPFWSKQVSMGIVRYRNATDPIQKSLRLYGGINPTSGKKQRQSIPNQFHDLAKKGKYPISNECCTYFKKSPAHIMARETGMKPYIGMKSSDSKLRKDMLARTGCNAYFDNHPTSNPLNRWTDEDIYRYVADNDIKICSLYSKDYVGTGCTGCTFGMAFDRYRFIRLKEHHRSTYDFYLDKCDYRGFFEEVNRLCKRRDGQPFILY